MALCVTEGLVTALISNVVEGLDILYVGALLMLAKDDELRPVAPEPDPLKENWIKSL